MKKKTKLAGDFLTASGRRWGGGKRKQFFRFLSRAFASLACSSIFEKQKKIMSV